MLGAGVAFVGRAPDNHMMYPPMTSVKALVAQIGAVVLLLGMIRFTGLDPAPLALAAMQAVLAATLALLMRSDRWWLLLHLCFVPAIVLTLRIGAPAWAYVLLLGLLLLTYGAIFRTQVPLFLSNSATVERLALWLEDHAAKHILDVGSGTGRFALLLARRLQSSHVTGYEQAFLPALLGRIAARRRDTALLRHGDFWSQHFGPYDVVYAFLSPVPMLRLWHKASAEMRPQSWLVSNSFPVPGRMADEVIEVDDARRTRLYCYRITGQSEER